MIFYFIFKYYNNQLKRELRRARKSEQLKSVFLANVSRSLRTPLNAILGYSNLILSEKDESMRPEQVRDMVSLIRADSQQLLDFISYLLELSNYEGSMLSFTLIEVNLAELMASYRREALNLTRPDVSVCLRTELSPHCKATLDTNFMHQLMMHLLRNAANHVIQGDIFIRYNCERKGLKVSIAYTGIGEAELVSEDIFAFLQKDEALKDAGKSSMFGIAICRAIVDMLGGEFYLDSGTDKKTVATFWFPCTMKDIYKDL